MLPLCNILSPVFLVFNNSFIELEFAYRVSHLFKVFLIVLTQLLIITNLLSVSIHLPVLDFSCK